MTKANRNHRSRTSVVAVMAATFIAASTVGTFGISAALAAGGPPSIEGEGTSKVTATSATLQATINTSGLYTGYWFQIDTNSSYDFTQANCPFEFPDNGECESITVGEQLPAGLVEPEPQYIPAGSGSGTLVSLDLSSIGATLQPDTTYHFRVLAADGGSPTVRGPDETFTTPPVPPTIENERTSGVTEHDATLEAQIQTNGYYTGYKFQLYNESYPDSYNFVQDCAFEPPEWGLCREEYAWVPPLGVYESGSQYIPAGSGAQSVSLDLASIGVTLEPGSTYHYRLLAADSGQIVRGAVQEFPTPSPSTAPPPSSSSGGVQPVNSPSVPGALTQESISTAPITPTKPKARGKVSKLNQALRACERETKKRRARCEHQSRGRYATAGNKTAKKK
jgi:hypothetical protein